MWVDIGAWTTLRFELGKKSPGQATHVKRKQLMCAGVCFGKFTHTRKFRLQITALDVLAKLARHKAPAQAATAQGDGAIRAAKV